jgi:uncharacterized membrane protein
MEIFSLQDVNAIKQVDTQKNNYLAVVGKGNSQHLEVQHKNWFGRFLMYLGISNASMKKVITYLEFHPFHPLKVELKNVVDEESALKCLEHFKELKKIANEGGPREIKEFTTKTAKWAKKHPKSFEKLHRKILRVLDEEFDKIENDNKNIPKSFVYK